MKLRHLRRAARLGDGWMGAGGTIDELIPMIDRMNDLRREYGREREPFAIYATAGESFSADGIKRLEGKGVTDCIVGFRVPYIKGPDTEPLETKIEHLNKYAESIISKVSL